MDFTLRADDPYCVVIIQCTVCPDVEGLVQGLAEANDWADRHNQDPWHIVSLRAKEKSVHD